MPGTIIVYKSNFGLELSKWDLMMNKLWYYTADRNKLWAKCLYYPILYLERIYYRLKNRDIDD